MYHPSILKSISISGHSLVIGNDVIGSAKSEVNQEDLVVEGMLKAELQGRDMGEGQFHEPNVVKVEVKAQVPCNTQTMVKTTFFGVVPCIAHKVVPEPHIQRYLLIAKKWYHFLQNLRQASHD